MASLSGKGKIVAMTMKPSHLMKMKVTKMTTKKKPTIAIRRRMKQKSLYLLTETMTMEALAIKRMKLE